MKPLASRLDAVRSSFRDLGPLRPIALYVAVAPTLGAIVLLVNLPAVAALAGRGGWWSQCAVMLLLGLLVGVAWLPASAVAFAAGYGLGAVAGTWTAGLAIAWGSVVAQAMVRLLPGRVFAFMHDRPRALAVQRFCRGRLAASALGVARLRWAARYPLPATNLLFAAAAVPKLGVFLGSLLGAVPNALLAAIAGDALRTWQERGELPGARAAIAAGAALLGAVCLLRASRRAWRAASAPPPEP